MLDALNDVIVKGADYVLGWILYLPRDVGLLVVAILTSAILTFVRLFTTDQSWLKRAAADKKRLGELIRQARAGKDKQAKQRRKQTLLTIKLKSLRFEGRPLLWAIPLVALLATWCFARLGYEPPAPGKTVEVRMFVPASAIGRHPHMIPQEGLEAETGWVQKVVRDRPAEISGLWDAFNAKVTGWLGMTPAPEGVAVWRLKPSGGRQHALKIWYDGRTYEKQLLVDPRRYAPPVAAYDDEKVTAVEVAMKPVKLFGVVGGLDFIFLPPWLVAYLLIAIPFMTILKRVFRIH